MQRHAVSRLRFGTIKDAWAFGPGLWATHDGGAHWSIPPLPQATDSSAVMALETDGSFVYAFLSTSFNHDTASGPGILLRSPVGIDHWAVVEGVHGRSPFGVSLTVQRPAMWLAVLDETASSSAFVTMFHSADGTSWAQQEPPCGVGTKPGEMALSAISATTVLAVCGFTGGAGGGGGMVPRQLFVSHDAGSTFKRLPDPPQGGDFAGVTTPTPSTITIAVVSAAGSGLEVSRDGSRSWTTPVFLPDGEEGWSDLGFPDPADGIVVHAPIPWSTDSSLYETHDGGASWSPVRVD